MREYRLRSDLQRTVINGFALPLGIEAESGTFKSPVQGYTVAYTPGEDDEPDTYAFHIVVSHERLAAIVHRAFDLLPDTVYAIVEIGSRDAYRSTDVYIGQEAISVDEFRQVWDFYEPFLLEEGAIAAGANSEEPFVEVFVDQWKGLSIHVPLEMRDEVEAMLQKLGLDEVPQTWVDGEEPSDADEVDALMSETSPARQVLDLADESLPDVDELLLELRHDWNLELNVDPQTNVDESGRMLGPTLWHAVILVESADGDTEPDGTARGGFGSVWATAGSMDEVGRLIESALAEQSTWQFDELYTIDRVAFDERPDVLAHLKPGQRRPLVHLMAIEPFDSQTPPDSPAPKRPPEDRRRRDEDGGARRRE